VVITDLEKKVKASNNVKGLLNKKIEYLSKCLTNRIEKEKNMLVSLAILNAHTLEEYITGSHS